MGYRVVYDFLELQNWRVCQCPSLPYFRISQSVSQSWLSQSKEGNCKALISIYLWLYSPFVGPWPLVQYFILYTVVRTPWTGDQPIARPLPTHRTTQTQNKRTQTSMPWVGFEPTISAFERAQTFLALVRAATVIGKALRWCRYEGMLPHHDTESVVSP
jgi:hypothetical protein